MCGVGAILLEASNTTPQAFYIGMDIDQSQIAKAYSNKLFYMETVREKTMNYNLLQGDVTGMLILGFVCSLCSVVNG